MSEHEPNRASWSFGELYGYPREHSPTWKPRAVSSNSTTNPLDQIVLVTGDTTLTLETAAGADGRQHTIIKTDSGTTMTVACTGSETIDGLSSVSTASQYTGYRVISDGVNWLRLTQPGATPVTDHGGLTGLTDDDHPQYLLSTGARAATFLSTGALQATTNVSSATVSTATVYATDVIGSTRVSTVTLSTNFVYAGSAVSSVGVSTARAQIGTNMSSATISTLTMYGTDVIGATRVSTATISAGAAYVTGPVSSVGVSSAAAFLGTNLSSATISTATVYATDVIGATRVSTASVSSASLYAATQVSTAAISTGTLRATSNVSTVTLSSASLYAVTGVSTAAISTGTMVATGQISSSVAAGTAAFVITSSTVIANLNANRLQNNISSFYLDSANFTGTNWVDLTDGGVTALHTHSGIGSNYNVTTITNAHSPYTVTATDQLIRCNASSAAITVVFPYASSATRELKVKKTDSSGNVVTISSAISTDRFDAGVTTALAVQYATKAFINGATSTWDIISVPTM